MEATEIELVRRVRAGDQDAFQGIVERYSRPLWNAAWRVLGDGEAAEDAVQEAFLRAWRAFSSFDDRAELSTWLYRIAVNAAIDQRRSRRRRQAVNLPEVRGADEEPMVPTSEPDPLRRTLSREVADGARQVLDKLPAAERTAFLLRHFEGCSIAEIARALGKGENATKQAVFRAVAKMRRALAPLVETPT